MTLLIRAVHPAGKDTLVRIPRPYNTPGKTLAQIINNL